MALATICPHCATTFRVASDQLKLRGGIVRCGACNEVFDGNAALVDTAAPAPADAAEPAFAAAPGAIPAPPAPPAPAAEAVPEPLASAAFDAEVAGIDAQQAESTQEPIFTLDFDTTFDPFGIMPKPQPEPEPEPEAEPPVQAPQPVADEEIIALPPPDEGPDHIDEPAEPPPARARDEPDLLVALLMRQSAAAEPAARAAPSGPLAAAPNPPRRKARRPKPHAPEPAVAQQPAPQRQPERPPGDHEPEFVRRVRRQQETGRTRRFALAAASALLLLALAMQAMTTWRNVLAARYPELKPVLAATCAVFGCKVELPAQIDVLSVETGELQSLDPATFSYTTLLRNPGSLVQAWPHIELALTDANNKPVVRRVFAPAQYLPAGVAPATGFAPGSEQAVKLTFELNQAKASGYHIAIFYP